MNRTSHATSNLTVLIMLAFLMICHAACSVAFDNSRITSLNIDARRYYKEGVQYGREGKTDLAIESYTRSIDIDPAAGAYNNRSAEYLKKERYDQAVSDANKAIQMSGKYAMPYFNRGNAFFKMNKFKSALKSYMRAIELDPAQAEFYFNCAQAYYRLDMIHESAGMYEKAIQADPVYYAAHYNLAGIHARNNDTRKAFESLEKAIDAGFMDAALVKRDSSFENIRNTPRFRGLIKKIEKKAKR